MSLSNKTVNGRIKPIVLTIMLIPFLWLASQWVLAFQGLPNDLGFNPHELSNRFSGDWALRFLMIGLCISPLARLTGLKQIMLLRRMVGLTAFFYTCIHIVSFVWLDKLLAWPELWQDILKRPYITVGMGAFLILVALAATSTRAAVKKMGARNWQSLHRLVYGASLLGGLHFIMMRKGVQLEPLIYTGIIIALLCMRLLPLRRLRLKTG